RQDSPGVVILGDPQLRSEAVASRGQGHHDLGEEMRGHRARETRDFTSILPATREQATKAFPEEKFAKKGLTPSST
ncbi:hypothetical protein A2U01_0047798, partial [Trifolium medium]|nr:hypothetical protein [Trifolium medium]